VIAYKAPPSLEVGYNLVYKKNQDFSLCNSMRFPAGFPEVMQLTRIAKKTDILAKQI